MGIRGEFCLIRDKQKSWHELFNVLRQNGKLTMKQFTIATSITAQGWDNVHQRTVNFVFNPSAENSGIILRRVDLVSKPEFSLNIDSLQAILPNLQTEHFDLNSFLPLLSVLRALEIDNITIDCESGFLPRMGDSAAMLLFTVQSAGLKQQNAMKKFITLTEPVMYKNPDGAWSRLIPSNKRRIAVLSSNTSIERSMICKDTMCDFSKAFFVSELCFARPESDIDKDLKHLTDSESGLTKRQHKLERLVKEKTLSHMMDAYSILSLLPYTLEADYVGFNPQKSENVGLLKKLLDSNAYKLNTDLSLADDSLAQETQNILAI